MTQAVKAGLISRSSIKQTFAGYNFTDVYSVTGLDSTSGTPVMVQALLAPGIPQFGEYVGFLPNCRVVNIEVDPKGATVCHVIVQWATPASNAQPWFGDGLRIRIGTTVNRDETVYAVDDNGTITGRMTVYANSGHDSPEAVKANVFRPITTMSLTRRMKKFPLTNSILYTGATNTDVWRGFQAGSVLCSGITGYSDDGELSYIVTYDFMISQEVQFGRYVGWLAMGAWVNPQTGQVSDTPDYPNNINWFQVQPAKNFAALGTQIAGTAGANGT